MATVSVLNMAGKEAVSYTHLDVYKRQVLVQLVYVTYLQKLRKILLVSYLSMRSMQLQDEEALDLVVDMMNVNRH